MSRVRISMADVILSCRRWIFLIFSAYTVFLMYPHRKKSSGDRSGLRGGQGIGPPLPIQASGNLSFKTSVTKQLKWGGAPSWIKITLLTISCSKVSICGNTYCSSYSGFKYHPSFSMTLYLLLLLLLLLSVVVVVVYVCVKIIIIIIIIVIMESDL